MSEENPDDLKLKEELEQLQAEVDKVMSGLQASEVPNEILQMNQVFFLWFLWADFHLYIIDPPPPVKVPPEIITLDNGRKIFDYGHVISTSVGDDLALGRYSSRKFLEAVDAVIDLAVSRYDIKEVAFQGNEVGKRKAFEAIMQYPDKNIVISNFTPGDWGELRLKVINELSRRGYMKLKSR
jgi:hypothetical protein